MHSTGQADIEGKAVSYILICKQLYYAFNYYK